MAKLAPALTNKFLLLRGSNNCINNCIAKKGVQANIILYTVTHLSYKHFTWCKMKKKKEKLSFWFMKSFAGIPISIVSKIKNSRQ